MPTADRRRGVLGAALLAYLLFLAYQSLAGGSFVPADCAIPLAQQGAKLSWSDGVANLVAYLPLGLLSAAWLGSGRGRLALLAGFLSIAAFSLAMELLQACLGGRVSSWFDWATNSSGGLLGLLALPRRLRAPWPAARAVGAPAAATLARLPLFWPVLLCVGAWLALSLAPWRFTLDIGTLRGNLAFLRHLSEWNGPESWRFARHLFGWLAVGVALRALWPRRLAASLAFALVLGASLAGQCLVVRAALSLDELAAMALALLLAVGLPSRSAEAVLARLVLVLALLAVGVYQLAPGHGWSTAARFEWWPQIGRSGMLSALALSLLFSWLAFSLVLTLCWLAERGIDIARRRLVLPVLVVGALLASEFAQLAIPGRLPDTSPPLVAALAFLVAWSLVGPAVRRPDGVAGSRRSGGTAPARPRAAPASRSAPVRDRAAARSRRRDASPQRP